MQEHLAQVTSLLDETTDLQQRASGLLPATQQDEEALHNALMDALDGGAGTWEDAEGNVHFPIPTAGRSAGFTGIDAEADIVQHCMEDHAPMHAEDQGHAEEQAGAVSKAAGASGIAPGDHMEFEDAYEELTSSYATVPFPAEGRDATSSRIWLLLHHPCCIPCVPMLLRPAMDCTLWLKYVQCVAAQRVQKECLRSVCWLRGHLFTTLSQGGV